MSSIDEICSFIKKGGVAKLAYNDRRHTLTLVGTTPAPVSEDALLVCVPKHGVTTIAWKQAPLAVIKNNIDVVVTGSDVTLRKE